MWHSGSSFFLAITLHLLAFFSGCEALPSPQNARRSSTNPLQGYVVPQSDGTTSLPSPSGTLKAIGVGRGTQNYTCAAASTATPTPVPVAVGAVATLFDASPALIPYSPAQGLLMLEEVVNDIVCTNFSTQSINNAVTQSKGYVRELGQHYFNAAGQPTFDLTQSGTGFLVAKKIGDIPAPAGASMGQTGQAFGAVDWLTLTDAGSSQGVSEVYRVATAGGKAPSACDGSAYAIQIQYAALYWFYD